MSDRTRVVVVGAGIAGLATAWYLQQRGIDVVVLEADDRVGGKVRSRDFGGLLLDVGPDIAAAARRHRSLILGLRADRRKAPPPDSPVFFGLRGGMERLTSSLAAKLDVSLSTPVDAVARSEGGRLAVAVRGAAPVEV